MHEADIQRMLRAELSLKSRVMYVIGLLFTATLAVALLSLWLTEPYLPIRTHVAFALLVLINFGWSVFCAWVLTRRKILYGLQAVIAGRLATLWTAVFTVGSLIAGASSGHSAAGLMAAGCGLVLLAIAVAMLIRARARRDDLLKFRRSIEQSLAAN
jgi:uncharacterized membrane protein YfcA